MMTLLIACTLLAAIHTSAHASTAELLKAAIDAADKAGVSDIKSVTETKMYRCVKCYEFEVKGNMQAAPDMDALAKVMTSGTMATSDHPGVTNASVGQITLIPKPQPPATIDAHSSDAVIGND